METNGQKETEKISVSHSNEGTINKNSVTIETERARLTLYFSYETIVCFNGCGDEATIKNYWSTTTGKFLNELQPNKNLRLDENEFKKRLRIALNSLF